MSAASAQRVDRRRAVRQPFSRYGKTNKRCGGVRFLFYHRAVGVDGFGRGMAGGEEAGVRVREGRVAAVEPGGEGVDGLDLVGEGEGLMRFVAGACRMAPEDGVVFRRDQLADAAQRQQQVGDEDDVARAVVAEMGGGAVYGC